MRKKNQKERERESAVGECGTRVVIRGERKQSERGERKRKKEKASTSRQGRRESKRQLAMKEVAHLPLHPSLSLPF